MSQRSESLSLHGGLTPSMIDSSEATPSLQFPSPLPTVTVDLPPSTTPPPRSHSAPPTSPIISNGTSKAHQLPPPSNIPADPEPLHTYSCPICFSSPTNATLTPCGHIMCGECLFTAVGAAAARMGIATLAARYVKRSPRILIPDTDLSCPDICVGVQYVVPQYRDGMVEVEVSLACNPVW